MWFLLKQFKQAAEARDREWLLRKARAAWVGQWVYCRTTQGELPGFVLGIDGHGRVDVLFGYDEQESPVCLTFPVEQCAELLRLMED